MKECPQCNILLGNKVKKCVECGYEFDISQIEKEEKSSEPLVHGKVNDKLSIPNWIIAIGFSFVTFAVCLFIFITNKSMKMKNMVLASCYGIALDIVIYVLVVLISNDPTS